MLSLSPRTPLLMPLPRVVSLGGSEAELAPAVGAPTEGPVARLIGGLPAGPATGILVAGLAAGPINCGGSAGPIMGGPWGPIELGTPSRAAAAAAAAAAELLLLLGAPASCAAPSRGVRRVTLPDESGVSRS